MASSIPHTILTLSEPLQILSTLCTAINFGGSVLQSPLIMPMVTSTTVGVPVHYTAQQTAYLLHNSEHFFPPLNALCTLTNLVLTGSAYFARGSDAVAAAKLPKLALATALNVATTAYALGVMVPMNKRMGALAQQLKEAEARGNGKEARTKGVEHEFLGLQQRWRRLNYGRAVIMILGAVVGASALVTRA